MRAVDKPAPTQPPQPAPRAAITNERVKHILDVLPETDKILDLGCAQHTADQRHDPNWLHQHLYRTANEVLGVDNAPAATETLTDAGYNVLCADVTDLSLEREYDVVVAGELIEHLADFQSFLTSAQSALNPSGTLVLSTPNPWAFHRFKQAVFGHVNSNDQHTCWFDEWTLRQTLSRCGFTTDRVEYVKPTTAGLTSVFYSLGFDVVGGTSIVAVAHPAGDADE
jgi:2-polyprenyl-3-methyl-5-hydroxy-6-metoxy-1,4-benzoquinol methylase